MREDSAETAAQAAISTRDLRVGAAALAGLGVVAVTVSMVWTTHGVEHGPELCPFRAMTGLPCPGCGLTRSWVFLGHGDVGAAVGFNAFGPVLFVVMVVATAVAGWTLISGRRGGWERLRRAVLGPVGIAIIVCWLVYGVVRIVDAAAGWGVFPTIA